MPTTEPWPLVCENLPLDLLWIYILVCCIYQCFAVCIQQQHHCKNDFDSATLIEVKKILKWQKLLSCPCMILGSPRTQQGFPLDALEISLLPLILPPLVVTTSSDLPQPNHFHAAKDAPLSWTNCQSCLLPKGITTSTSLNPISWYYFVSTSYKI